MSDPFTIQHFYRTRSDTSAAENGTPVWETTENQSAALSWSTATTFRIRFVLDNTGAMSENGQFVLRVNKNSSSYVAISTTSADVQSADASSSSDGETLTVANFELTAGTGTGADGDYDEAGSIDTNIASGGFFELEWGLTIVDADVTAGDTLDFRIYAGGAALDDYSTFPDSTPRITVAGSDTNVETNAPDALLIAEQNPTLPFRSAGIDVLVIAEQQATVNAETNINTNAPDALVIAEQNPTLPFMSMGVDALVLTEQVATVNAATNIDTNAPDALIIAEQLATISLGVTIDASTDALVIAEQIPTLPFMSMGVAALVIAEQIATVNAETNVNTNAPDALIIAGQLADVNLNVTLDAGVDELVIAEQLATVNAETNINTNSPDALIIAEQQATVNAETNVNAGVDALVIAEQTPTLPFMSAGVDALVLASQVANVNAETNVNTNSPDALVIAEHIPTLPFMSAGVDALVISEKSATISAGAGTNVNASTDALVITEQNPTLPFMSMGVDALVLAEQQATVNAETNINAFTDALILTEHIPTLPFMSAGVDALVIAEQIPTLPFMSMGVDSLVLASQLANVNAETNINTNAPDALVISGKQATISLGGTNVNASTDVLILAEQSATVKLNRVINTNTDALTLTVYVSSVVGGERPVGIASGEQMITTISDSSFPLEVAVDHDGGVTGLTITASVRDVDDSTSYLDFNDDTFKTSGWTAKTLTLSEFGLGFYGSTLDISAITNLPVNHLAVEYDIVGAVTAVTNSVITFRPDPWDLITTDHIIAGSFGERVSKLLTKIQHLYFK